MTSHWLSDTLAKVPGVLHGFGTRKNPVPQNFAGIWDEGRPEWKQVHGVSVARVTRGRQGCGGVDALFTLEKDVPIGIVTADCVPVLLARRSGGAVACAHAGWRGTRAGILRVLWTELARAGEKPGDWVAAVGPAIGPCCYEVSDEIAQDFAREFSWISGGVAVPRHRMLDLPAINAAELTRLGLASVDLVRGCTRCTIGPDGPLFHSFRREGGGTRQFSIIVAGSAR